MTPAEKERRAEQLGSWALLITGVGFIATLLWTLFCITWPKVAQILSKF